MYYGTCGDTWELYCLLQCQVVLLHPRRKDASGMGKGMNKNKLFSTVTAVYPFQKQSTVLNNSLHRGSLGRANAGGESL